MKSSEEQTAFCERVLAALDSGAIGVADFVEFDARVIDEVDEFVLGRLRDANIAATAGASDSMARLDAWCTRHKGEIHEAERLLHEELRLLGLGKFQRPWALGERPSKAAE